MSKLSFVIFAVTVLVPKRYLPCDILVKVSSTICALTMASPKSASTLSPLTALYVNLGLSAYCMVRMRVSRDKICDLYLQLREIIKSHDLREGNLGTSVSKSLNKER